MILDAFGGFWLISDFLLEKSVENILGRTFFWAISAEKVDFQVRKVEKSKKKHF